MYSSNVLWKRDLCCETISCEQRRLKERGNFSFSVLCGEFSRPSMKVPYAMLPQNAEIMILKSAIRFRNQSTFSTIN